MWLFGILSLLLSGILDVTIGSAFNPFHGMSVEDSVTYLYEKFLLFENREASAIAQEVRKEIMTDVQDAEKRFLEGKDQLAAKIAEVEIAFTSKQNDLLTRLRDLEERAAKQREEMFNTLSEMNAASRRSFEELSERLTNERDERSSMDNHILTELHQLQRRALETDENINNVKNEIASVSEVGRNKTDMLEVRIDETKDLVHSCRASQRETEDAILKNMSSSVQKWRMYVNERIAIGFENMKTNLTTKMGNLENALLAFRKDCVNVSYASSLEESIQNLSNATKSEFQSIHNELYPRIKGLEDRSDSMNDVMQMKKVLTNHTSDISSLNTRLIRVQNRCSDPPYVENGYPIYSGLEGRNHESVISYDCRGDKIPAGNKVMECQFGKWIGELPQCVDRPICDPPCQNGGKCEKNNVCSCKLLFSGDRCQQVQCGVDLQNVGVNGSGMVGGNTSTSTPDWPWLAAVYRKRGKDSPPVFQCPGSIIHRQFILTSARCMYDWSDGGWNRLNGTDLTVRLGLTALSDFTHLQEFNVRTIYVHPLFDNSKYWDYDVALLELEKPVDYNIFVRPVCLPTEETPGDNRFYEPQSTVHVVVWRNGTQTERHFTAQPRDICSYAFGDRFTDRLFCVAGDSCLNMRGSPALQSHPNAEGARVWTQVGVGAWYCTRHGGKSLARFARLQALMPWLHRTLGG